MELAVCEGVVKGLLKEVPVLFLKPKNQIGSSKRNFGYYRTLISGILICGPAIESHCRVKLAASWSPNSFTLSTTDEICWKVRISLQKFKKPTGIAAQRARRTRMVVGDRSEG